MGTLSKSRDIRGTMRASRLSGLSLSFVAEKRLHQIHTTSCKYSTGDFDLMIQLGMIQHLQHGVNCTSFRVLGAIDQSVDSCVGDGSGTHGARFNRDVEIAIRQAVIGDNVARFSQRLYFRVRRWVVIGDWAIAAAAHDVSFAHDDCADRDLAERESPLRFAQSFFHEQFIGARHEGEG